MTRSPSVRMSAIVRRPAGRPAQHRLDSQGQFARAERLGHVVVRAEFEPDDPIRLAAQRREHDDRHLADLARMPAADLEPVDARQHQVEHQQVRTGSSPSPRWPTRRQPPRTPRDGSRADTLPPPRARLGRHRRQERWPPNETTAICLVSPARSTVGGDPSPDRKTSAVASGCACGTCAAAWPSGAPCSWRSPGAAPPPRRWLRPASSPTTPRRRSPWAREYESCCGFRRASRPLPAVR